MIPQTDIERRQAEFTALDTLRKRFRLTACVAGKYDALCPAHDDHSKSLRVYRCDDGKLRFRCYAGCGFNAIRQALGLSTWGGKSFIPPPIRMQPRHRETKPTGYDYEQLAERFATDGPTLAPLAEKLKLSVRSLLDSDVGRCERYPMFSRRRDYELDKAGATRYEGDADVPVTAWTFPMKDAGNNVTGLRMRGDDGRKFSFTDSTPGLFIGNRWTGKGPIVFVEGASDRCQCFDWGFDAIGYPSCNDGFDLILSLYVNHLRYLDKRRPVVIIANNDDAKKRPISGEIFYPGQEGGEQLAELLALHVYPATLKLIIPPPGVKDCRDWAKQGASRQTVNAMIGARSIYFSVKGSRQCPS